MTYITQPYSERLRKAIVRADKQPTPEQAVFVLKAALESEIKTAEKIVSMPQFRAWLAGERFEDVVIRANKRV